jgi:type II secretory pathway component GspD/PulD (secretin)
MWLYGAVWMLLIAFPTTGFAQILSLDGGEIVLNTTDTSLREILDRFSDLLNADIYIVGGDDEVRFTLYQRHTNPLRLLASVLKSHSYALVYRDKRGEVRTLADAVRPAGQEPDFTETNRGYEDEPRPAPDPDFVEETTKRQRQHMRTHFEKEIANLKKMIANGEAENYFPEPEARLASLEDRLSQILED